MNLQTHIKSAFSNITTSKLRSILTILGVLVGTASVVALVSGGELATQQALEQFKALGTNLMSINIQPKQGEEGASSGSEGEITVDQLSEIAQSDPNIVSAAGYVTTYEAIQYEGNTVQGGIVGADQNLQKVLKLKLQSGRFVSELDGNERFAVLGIKVYEELREAGALDVLGKQILAGTAYFTIVGILEETPQNFFMYADINQSLIVPLSSALQMSKYSKINNIIFNLKEGGDPKEIEDHVQAKIHSLVPGQQTFPRDSQELISGMKKQSQTFTILLGFIGGISLLVGGIGVMNIMLVSVVERRREIGIRMAIGAKKLDIQYMFLTESVLLCVFGGVLGIIAGILASYVTARFSDWAFHIYMMPPTIGFFVSALVGIFFGYYPAKRASNMDPIDCLQEE